MLTTNSSKVKWLFSRFAIRFFLIITPSALTPSNLKNGRFSVRERRVQFFQLSDDSNPGWMGGKRERHLCALPSPQDSPLDDRVQLMKLGHHGQWLLPAEVQHCIFSFKKSSNQCIMRRNKPNNMHRLSNKKWSDHHAVGNGFACLLTFANDPSLSEIFFGQYEVRFSSCWDIQKGGTKLVWQINCLVTKVSYFLFYDLQFGIFNNFQNIQVWPCLARIVKLSKHQTSPYEKSFRASLSAEKVNIF